MRCPKESTNIVELHRTTKKTLDGLKLKCKYGCEVPLLSYNTHLVQCEIAHKEDVTCWNCGNITNCKNVKQIKMIDTSQMKQEIENLKEVKDKNVELNDEIKKLQIKIIEQDIVIATNTLNYNKDIITNTIESIETIIKEKEKYLNIRKELGNFMQKLEIKYKEDDVENDINTCNSLQNKLNELIKSKASTEEEIENYGKKKLELLKDIQLIQQNKENAINNNNNNNDANIINGGDELRLHENPIENQVSNCFILPNSSAILTRFEFSNNNKTVKMISTSGYDWFGFMCKEKVPVNCKKYEFTIRIDKINTYADIMIGFCVGNTYGDKGFRNTNSSWMCFLNNGLFFNTGDRDYYFGKANVIKPKDGDLISICIELDTNIIYLKRNKQIVSNNLKMKMNDVQKMNLVPCIDMTDVGDQITIM